MIRLSQLCKTMMPHVLHAHFRLRLVIAIAVCAEILTRMLANREAYLVRPGERDLPSDTRFFQILTLHNRSLTNRGKPPECALSSLGWCD